MARPDPPTATIWTVLTLYLVFTGRTACQSALPAFKESINFSILAKYLLRPGGVRAGLVAWGSGVMTTHRGESGQTSSRVSPAPPGVSGAGQWRPVIGRHRGVRRRPVSECGPGCQLGPGELSITPHLGRPVDGWPSPAAHWAQSRECTSGTRRQLPVIKLPPAPLLWIFYIA